MIKEPTESQQESWLELMSQFVKNGKDKLVLAFPQPSLKTIKSPEVTRQTNQNFPSESHRCGEAENEEPYFG